jgi:hypothetical protein
VIVVRDNKVPTSFRVLQQFLLNLVVFLRAGGYSYDFVDCNKRLSGGQSTDLVYDPSIIPV